MDIEKMTMKEVAEGIRSGKWSSREATEECLKRAEGGMDSTHAYVGVMREDALKAADEADKRQKEDKLQSKLDGVPVAVKDNMLVAGFGATAGSGILKDYVASYDGTVVARIKAAGAVIIGKTNMDEFAMGSTTETSFHGPTRNPWDQEKIPGGSSGGSVVAVTEGSAVVALGSDTGGSIRQPASMCGVVGMKPTYGRVSRYGLMAMASSLDQIGPIARSAEDCADLLRVIEGHDRLDSTSVDMKLDWTLPESLPESLKGLKVGLPREYFGSGMDHEVEKTIMEGVNKLEDLGAEVKEVSLPHTDYCLSVYYIVMPSEVSANLARFDGIRYGTRVHGETLEETYRRSRGQGFGKEARRRVMLGTYALSSGYYDAYYLRAMKVRRLIANDFAHAFSEVDCLVTPTAPTAAWDLGEKMDDPLTMYLSDVHTVGVNVAGLPAISVPCGFVGGLPVGMQIIGKQFDDKTVLGAAHAYEIAADNRKRFVPPVSK